MNVKYFFSYYVLFEEDKDFQFSTKNLQNINEIVGTYIQKIVFKN